MLDRTAARTLRLQEAGLLLVVLLLGALITLSADTLDLRGQRVNAFLRWDNLLANVATPMSWMAIMALGATAVIVAGGIDISVGSIFGLSALGTAAVLQQLPPDTGLLPALGAAAAVALGIGLACGLLNGALVVGLRLHPFIVTLGTLSIFRGIGLVSVRTKTLPDLGRELPSSFTEDFVGWRWVLDAAPGGAGGGAAAANFVQPVPMLAMLGCAAFFWLLLAHTVSGREIYAVGGNEEAARYAGLRVGRIKLRVYALSGLCAGLAGLLSCGFYQSANTATGEGYELAVIAAAVVGGASLQGGRGTALGAVLGALVIKLIENGIDIVRRVDLGLFTLSVSKEYGKIIIGVAILLAVAVDRLAERWRGASG
ncbi:MAG TPA: ABC transporter permease [Planctomycetota bacterium]|nr:ABC transporter permease [Planctomycetota bacterium]